MDLIDAAELRRRLSMRAAIDAFATTVGGRAPWPINQPVVVYQS